MEWNPDELTWVHLASLGFTWAHLGSFGLAWAHLGSRGLAWARLGVGVSAHGFPTHRNITCRRVAQLHGIAGFRDLKSHVCVAPRVWQIDEHTSFVARPFAIQFGIGRSMGTSMHARLPVVMRDLSSGGP